MFNRHHNVLKLFTKKLLDTSSQILSAGQIKQKLPIVCQTKMNVRISQGLLYQMLLNVLKFCGGCFEKFQAGRCIVKKTFDSDFCTYWKTYFSDLFQVAALINILVAP